MPYIRREDRSKVDGMIERVTEIIDREFGDSKGMVEMPSFALEGVLNCIITKIIDKLYKPSYFNYNRVMGLLECIKQEFYRRKIAPYEDKKRKENGDVF